MRLGIIGAGNIVKMCLDALEHIEDIDCCALFVRETSLEKGQALCAQYGISKLYSDYQEMLNDEDIEFVYIGIPNNMHFEYALAALEANKHVICEKPFTNTVEELVTLNELAKQRSLFLFEAVTNIHSPNVALFKDYLPKIGQVKLVQGNYSQLSSRYANYLQEIVHPAFDPACSGGALYDINIYNIHLACYLFGKPENVQYSFNRGFNGVDTSGVMLLTYPDFIAVCAGAKDSASDGHFTVQGEEGYLVIRGTPNIVPSLELHIGGEKVVCNLHDVDNHMVYEFRAFEQMFAARQYEQCYGLLQHSVDVMTILQAGKQQLDVPIA
ncbi:Gfo/Idh/MocA family protein [Vibrio nitrifigilis]|uniref:Gfo/Idh/MocA family oxidoreductase n=1 Tax=Vibrio nitrifigilis TaxID=2789781 RepID=A0ABS0GCR3_9VIBR|nr:Gfo/Idh/MocA family oxidoreductase [Vibrio nitrifigilis]MBF9000199.1 Gfo/Idh/MocA family oxidoreductase [Vibrio nitrifigilis]